MAEQPESLSISCLFPSLGGNVGTQAAPAREATLTPIPDLEPNLLAENKDVCALFAAAWSLVLYRFILVEEVSFTIHGSSATSLVTVVIQPEEPVRQLVDIYSSQRITSSQLKDSDRINSGLAFSSSSSSCIQAFHSSNCQIGLVIDLNNLRVCLWSRPEFISDQQAGSVASAVSQAIHGIVASPDQAIGAVSIFSNQHLAQIAEWNGHHPISDPPATSVYELIQPLCQSQPDAPAISAWDGEVSYGQMDALTSQLAAHLKEMGVKPNKVVALCFGKSLWAMISMLAVIRTGSAFVFLAPSHPASHRKHILSQACPVMILTTPTHERLFDDEGIPVVSVTETLVSQLSSPSPSGCFKPVNDIQDPAYLIFTSGSSGTPKGCAIDHGSLAGMIPLERAWPFDKTCNRIFQFAPFVFGTSMLEFFSAWLTGGVLYLPSDDEWKNDLVGAISRSRATGLVLPVSLAKLISPDMIPTVRMLAVGGEPLDDSLFDRWVDRVRLVQGYGMSENAGILAVNDGLTRESDPRNVGQSPNGRIWLVSPDDHHQLAPIGAVAEILFESPGIARKYINNPEKSSATFVEPPPWLQRFNTLSGRGRFLKSGDLARYNADGTINHLGRKDSQVKIRGQRVDVKEVELSLRLHFGTTIDFFVELVRPKHGTPVLAAFMWSKESDKLIEKSTSDHDLVVIPRSLRSQLETADSSLRSNLPDYMLPPLYLLMAKLPTTITGKVDRRKLRENASALTRTELESLMHGQTNEQMLPPTTPMEQPNYRELEHLESDHLPQMGIDKHDVCDTYPCSSMQQGKLLAQTVDPSGYKAHMTWRTSHTNSNEVVDTERLRGAWSAVVQRHPALRTVFSPHPGENTKRHNQLVLSPAKAYNVAKVVHSTSGDQPDPVQRRKYSLPQLTLQRQTSGDVDCLLEMDHPVIDGFSTQILMRDLALAYDGRLPMDCVPQVMKHESAPKEDAKAYWATLLRNRDPCQFPIMNKERGDHPARATTYHSMDIELGHSSLLHEASRKHGVTVSDIFQVAWALVLQAFTGQSSVCFGYMVSGRDSTMETAWDAVGFFANIVTRAIDLGPQKTPFDVLQETQRDFVDNQHITPLDISHHLFNTMVSFSNAMAESSTSTSGGSLKFEVTDVLDYPEFDVTLEGSELDGKIGAQLKYWDSILSYEQAQSVAGVFQQAIGLLLTSPQQPLNQLHLLSDKDEQQIMEWRRHMPVRTQTECLRFLQLYGTF